MKMQIVTGHKKIISEIQFNLRNDISYLVYDQVMNGIMTNVARLTVSTQNMLYNQIRIELNDFENTT